MRDNDDFGLIGASQGAGPPPVGKSGVKVAHRPPARAKGKKADAEHGSLTDGEGPDEISARTPEPEVAPAKEERKPARPVLEARKDPGAVPAASEQAPAAQAAPPPVRRSEDTLTEGVLKVNVPATMLVGQSEHVRAVVGKKMHVALVDKEAALETNDGARVQLGRDLLLTPLVQMELRCDTPGDFDIVSFSPDPIQRISDNDATVWEWAVMPKQEGKRGLTLVVTDLKEGTRERVRTKIYPVHIEVHVGTMQKVREIAVAGSSALSGLAGLIGAWLGLLRPALQRRRSEGEYEQRPPRPPAAAAPPPPAPPVAVAPPAASAGPSPEAAPSDKSSAAS